jgi:hypothetical protein
MAIGIPWGAVGVAVAHIAATVLLMVPKLYFSFAGSPVTMRAFCRTLTQPVIATAAMGTVLVITRRIADLDGGAVSLMTGSVAGGVTFVAAILAMPGASEQVRSLWTDVLIALGYRGRNTDRVCELAQGLGKHV